MTGYLSSIIIISVVCLFSVLAVPVDAWQNALCSVRILGLDDHISCSSMRDSLTFAAGNNIGLALDNQTNTITISSTAEIPEPIVSSGQTLVTSGEADGLGVIIHDIIPGDVILVSFSGDYTAPTPDYNIASLSVNNIIADTTGFTIPQFATIPFTLQDHYTALGGEDLVVTVSSDGMVSSGKIVWSQYR